MARGAALRTSTSGSTKRPSEKEASAERSSSGAPGTATVSTRAERAWLRSTSARGPDKVRGEISACWSHTSAHCSSRRATLSESLVFEAGRDNRALDIVSARVFLRAVEFTDGQVWVPARAALDSLRLGVFLPPSSETTRLWHAYRQRGTQALAAELKK